MVTSGPPGSSLPCLTRSAHFDEKHQDLAESLNRKRKKSDKKAINLINGNDQESIGSKISRIELDKEPSAKPLRCEFCPRVFVKPKVLQNHLRSKHPGKVASIQKEISAAVQPRKTGENYADTADKTYRCNFCDEGFPSEGKCVEHLVSVHRVRKIEESLTTFFDSGAEDYLDEDSHQELEQLERERCLTSLTNESDDLVVKSVSFMIKQQLKERQRSQGHVKFEGDHVVRQNADPRENASVSTLNLYKARSEIECHFCRKAALTQFGLNRHIKAAHPEAPDMEEQNYIRPKLTKILACSENNGKDNPDLANNNSNSYNKYKTIRVFEADGRTLGLTVHDQMLLSKILSRKLSIQLNLRFSGAKKTKSKRSSFTKGDSAGHHSVEAAEHQAQGEVLDIVESEELGPEDLGQVKPDKQKSTLWCSKCGLEFCEIKDLHQHLSEHRLTESKTAEGKVKTQRESYHSSKNPDMGIVKKEVDEESSNNVDMGVDVDDDNVCVCVICNEAFESEASLTRHEDEVHIRKEPKTETKPQSWSHDQPTNREKPYSCSACHKLFKHWRSKTKHEEKYHNIEPPTGFPNSSALRSQLEGNIQDDGSVLDSSKKGGNISYSCNFCSKSYSRISTLKEHHLMMHEKKLDFQCKQCDQGCVTGAKLRTHQKQKHQVL